MNGFCVRILVEVDLSLNILQNMEWLNNTLVSMSAIGR